MERRKMDINGSGFLKFFIVLRVKEIGVKGCRKYLYGRSVGYC